MTTARSMPVSTPDRTRMIAGLFIGERGPRRLSMFFYREYTAMALVPARSRVGIDWVFIEPVDQVAH